MTEQERELAMKAGMAWDKAGPELERIRRNEIRATNTMESVRILAGGFQSAAFMHPPRKSSGLVEQQKWFKQLHEIQLGQRCH
jgi:hypothetical protein